MRSRCCLPTLVTAALLGIGFQSPIAAQISSPAGMGETQEQLVAGTAPGTFAFSYTGRIEFTQESAFPVTVGISDDLKKKLATVTVNDTAPFTISANLAPGGYWVNAEVAPDKDTLYWGGGLINVFIDPTGKATVHDRAVITLMKKMTVISPDLKGADLAEKRPVLKWQPLQGATRYQVFWLIEQAGSAEHAQGSAFTDDTQFQMTEDVVPNRRYEWSVYAHGADGSMIGYYSAAYFYTPGGRDSFKQAMPAPRTGGKGIAYLGVSPVRFGGVVPGSIAGITVMNVMAGSPALAAGLQPHDVLTRFNDQSLENMSVRDFVGLIRTQPIGSVVTVEFRRGNETKTTRLTVASMP